jgi:hypothetical protein
LIVIWPSFVSLPAVDLRPFIWSIMRFNRERALIGHCGIRVAIFPWIARRTDDCHGCAVCAVAPCCLACPIQTFFNPQRMGEAEARLGMAKMINRTQTVISGLSLGNIGLTSTEV